MKHTEKDTAKVWKVPVTKRGTDMKTGNRDDKNTAGRGTGRAD